MIITQDLRRTFQTRAGTVEAVCGVNLNVRKGEIFGFLGPNGAGKSTTMRMLATLLEPSGGSAQVTGYDLLKEPRKVREFIGYVGQAGGAEPSATGRENLLLQGQLYRMDSADAQQRADQLASALELEAFIDRQVKTYSGGQRRRLELAMGMFHHPTLLFLDEPTTGLDPQSRARLWDEIRLLRDEGTTIFLTTHYLDEADALCDRLAIIDNGQIVGEGSPESLKQQIAGDIITLGFADGSEAIAHAQNYLKDQPFVRDMLVDGERLHVYVERGETNLPVVLRLLDAHDTPIQTVALSRPSLDDVFLRLTGRSLREASQS